MDPATAYGEYIGATLIEPIAVPRLADALKTTFERNPGRPLEVDLLVVDEVSMVDITLFHHLLKALPAHCLTSR